MTYLRVISMRIFFLDNYPIYKLVTLRFKLYQDNSYCNYFQFHDGETNLRTKKINLLN